jgi:hypothetical protein
VTCHFPLEKFFQTVKSIPATLTSLGSIREFLLLSLTTLAWDWARLVRDAGLTAAKMTEWRWLKVLLVAIVPRRISTNP